MAVHAVIGYGALLHYTPHCACMNCAGMNLVPPNIGKWQMAKATGGRQPALMQLSQKARKVSMGMTGAGRRPFIQATQTDSTFHRIHSIIYYHIANH